MSLFFLTILVRFLEGLFVVGGIGSVFVLVLSGIEDIKTLFGGEDDHF
jgi:hypothetical protein